MLRFELPESRASVLFGPGEGNAQIVVNKTLVSQTQRVLWETVKAKTAITSGPYYDGELERFILGPLYTLAVQYHQGKLTENQVQITFFKLSQSYAIISKIIALGGFKNVGNELGEYIAANSDVVSSLAEQMSFAFAPTDTNLKGQNMGNFISELGRTGKALKPEEIIAATRKLSVTISDPSDVSAVQKLLVSQVGRGSGAVLPEEMATEMKRRHSLISFTIQKVLEVGAVTDNDLSFGAKITPMSFGDKVAFTVAYIHYLDMIADYNMNAPRIDVLSAPQAAFQHYRNAAVKLSTFFNDIACAPANLWVHWRFKQIDTAWTYFSSLLKSLGSQADDMKKFADNKKAQFQAVAASNYLGLANTVHDAIRAFTGAEEMLSPLWADLIPKFTGVSKDTVSPTFPFSGHVKNKSDLKKFYNSDAPRLLGYLSIELLDVTASIELIAQSNEVVQTALGESFMPQSSWLGPIDWPKPQITPIDKVEYASPIDNAFLSMRIPRYTETVGRFGPTWIFEDKTYQNCFLLPLLYSALPKQGWFVWPNRGEMPVASIISASYANAAIPYEYVKTRYSKSFTNTWQDYLSQLGTEYDNIPPRMAYKGIAELFSEFYSAWGRDIADTLASHCFVWLKPIGGEKYYMINPGMPSLYGAPAAAFKAANVPKAAKPVIEEKTIEKLTISKRTQWAYSLDKDDKLFESNERTLIFDLEDGSSVAFVLHNAIPPVSPVMYIPFAATKEATILVPISLSALMQEWTALYPSNTAVDPMNAQDLSDLLSKRIIDPVKPKSWKALDSWARMSSAYPHVLFDYSPSGTESFEGVIEDMYEAASYFVVRSWMPTSQTLKVWKQQKVTLVAFEASDVNKESIDPVIQGAKAVVAPVIVPESKEPGSVEHAGTSATPGSPSSVGSPESAGRANPDQVYQGMTIDERNSGSSAEKVETGKTIPATKTIAIKIGPRVATAEDVRPVDLPGTGAPEDEQPSDEEIASTSKKKKKYKKELPDGKFEFKEFEEGEEIPSGFVPAED